MGQDQSRHRAWSGTWFANLGPAVMLAAATILLPAVTRADVGFGIPLHDSSGMSRVVLTPQPYAYSWDHSLEPGVREPMFVEVLDDGSMLVGTSTTLTRLSATGVKDPTFGYASGGVAGRCVDANRCNARFGPFMLQRDGTILVPMVASSTSYDGSFGVVKLRPDGKRDPAFGNDGVALLAPLVDMVDLVASGIVVGADGRLLVVGSSSCAPSWTGYCWSAARLEASGTPDVTFGRNARKVLAEYTFPNPTFARGTNGAFALAGAIDAGFVGETTYGMVARFLPTGTEDRSFNPHVFEQASTVPISLAIDRDSSIVLMSTTEEGADYAFVQRLARLRPDGTPDPTFKTSIKGAAYTEGVGQIAIDSKGRIVVFAATTRCCSERESHNGNSAPVSRLLADGSPDTTFAASGTQWFLSEGFALRALAIGPGDRIILAGLYPASFPHRNGSVVSGTERQALVALGPGDGLRKTWVSEFRQTGTELYFYTAIEAESKALFSAWQQSGGRYPWMPTEFNRVLYGFSAWSEPGPGLLSMCRFFSADSFAPAFTHRYTYDPAECAALKSDPKWIYEGEAFYVRPPDGPAGQRTCPPGTQVLTAVFTGGASGVPNARLGTRIGQDWNYPPGWRYEGDGTHVFACVPT